MSPRPTRGQREYTGLMGSSPEEGLAEVRLRSPQMYDAVVEGAFGQMMAQAGAFAPPALRRVRLADHETLVAQSGAAGPAVVLIYALGLDLFDPAAVGASMGGGTSSPPRRLPAAAGARAPRRRTVRSSPPRSRHAPTTSRRAATG